MLIDQIPGLPEVLEPGADIGRLGAGAAGPQPVEDGSTLVILHGHTAPAARGEQRRAEDPRAGTKYEDQPEHRHDQPDRELQAQQFR